MSASTTSGKSTGILLATVVILATIGWLAFTGTRDNKSYYVTISELQGMGKTAYTRHLRVAGNVAPGSIQRHGPGANFNLLEQGKILHVVYVGSEPPPDTFKDDAQALAVGTYGKDGVFHATQLQAKCASKYAPVGPGKMAAPAGSAAAPTPAASPSKISTLTPPTRAATDPRSLQAANSVTTPPGR